MGIHDLFSKRLKRASKKPSDIFVYDPIPAFLRTQFLLIVKKYKDYRGVILGVMHEILSEEVEEYPRGLKPLTAIPTFGDDADTVGFIDLVEAFFAAYRRLVEDRYSSEAVGLYWSGYQSAREEMNARFLEHAVGYQVDEEGKVYRIDSTFAHAEVTKPALALLVDPMYKVADAEFRLAHEHYREGRYPDCILNAGKAFESTMKAICEKRGWGYDPEKDTANKLVDICMRNGLLPEYLQKQINGLDLMVKSVADVRNKRGGHGSHPEVPQHLAAYMLHLVAANVLMLANAERQL